MFVFLFLLIASNSYADGLAALVEVSKGQQQMEKILNKETETYEVVKKALETGSIEKGQSQDLIRKRYGEPILIIPEKEGMKRWVYKPGYATHFDKIKIYLFFDEDKKLKEVKILNKES